MSKFFASIPFKNKKIHTKNSAYHCILLKKKVNHLQNSVCINFFKLIIAVYNIIIAFFLSLSLSLHFLQPLHMAFIKQIYRASHLSWLSLFRKVVLLYYLASKMSRQIKIERSARFWSASCATWRHWCNIFFSILSLSFTPSRFVICTRFLSLSLYFLDAIVKDCNTTHTHTQDILL